MARRIGKSVIRGEIDNRQKGVVHGRLWLEALTEPVKLELTGNACVDLAGCLMKFTNRRPAVPLRRDLTFDPLQRGCIGDLTASRKVPVPDVPYDEAHAIEKRRQKPPEHIANALYLEWFSEANGRVVIESTDFEVEISPPEWRPTADDERQRLSDARAGWNDFLDQLDAKVKRHQRGAKDPEEEWDELDYERFFRVSDARTDKYGELLEKYGHSDEAHDKIAAEMGWARELTEEEAEEERRRIDEINAACEAALTEPPPEPEPHREGIDWIRTADGDIRHPLQHRCFEGAMRIWHRCDELGLRDLDDDVALFLFEFQQTAVKLAGALNGLAEGCGPEDPAFTVAYLKRGLDHLHKAQAALETVATKRREPEDPEPRLPESLVVEARREMFDVREGILRLMHEFREQR
jgi:hypothetical protein